MDNMAISLLVLGGVVAGLIICAVYHAYKD
jgi:hypothetical protein